MKSKFNKIYQGRNHKHLKTLVIETINELGYYDFSQVIGLLSKNSIPSHVIKDILKDIDIAE